VNLWFVGLTNGLNVLFLIGVDCRIVVIAMVDVTFNVERNIESSEQPYKKQMRFCGDSLSEVSNCSLDLCKSEDSRRILASALIYAYPPLKDSAPWLCTLALHPVSAPCLCTLFCTLYHGAGTFTVPVG
jgi:hypothetical protein